MKKKSVLLGLLLMVSVVIIIKFTVTDVDLGFVLREDENKKQLLVCGDAESSVKSPIKNKDIELKDVQVTVLMYHHFSEEESSSTTIHPDEFEEQLSYLQASGYETITDHELARYMEGKAPLPDKPLLLTIDDGYESNYIYAYPILKKLNLQATIYVIGSGIRENNETPYTPNAIPKISWEQAREMYESGVMEIQSHTYDMHHKQVLESGANDAVIKGPIEVDGEWEATEGYKQRVKDDLNLNKQLIEENIGNTVVSLTYPYGAFNDDSEAILKELGYRLSFTVRPGINDKANGPFLLNRINIPHETTGKDIEEMIKEFEK